jgi:hypothetical protein
MHMHWGIFLCCTLLLPARLAAQDNREWPQRIFVTIDVPFQPLSSVFSESVSFADALRRNENVSFDATYESSRGPLFDVGIGVRLMKNMGVGLTTSWVQRSATGSFTIAVPNPLVANRPLDLSGAISDLDREELGIHIQALYALPLGKRGRLMLSGGPSIVNVKQDIVQSIEFVRLPGFTALTFDAAHIVGIHQTVAGFNVGADITWPLYRHVGVGTIARYSRATVTMNPDADSGISREITMHVGGLHIGGGVRLLF